MIMISKGKNVAVGFKLSDVLSIDVLEESSSIVFTTKFIVYELVFDDVDKVKDLIKNLNKFTKPRKQNNKEVETPDFYIDRKLK